MERRTYEQELLDEVLDLREENKRLKGQLERVTMADRFNQYEVEAREDSRRSP